MNKPCLDFRAPIAKQGKAVRPHKRVLKPVSRETGEAVTLRNCKGNECRWGYGPPHADMVLCGRKTVQRTPWCEEHGVMAYNPKPLARL